MKISAIDIETTGLDPNTNQIIELAVVTFDTEVAGGDIKDAVATVRVTPQTVWQEAAYKMHKKRLGVLKLTHEQSGDNRHYDHAAGLGDWLRIMLVCHGWSDSDIADGKVVVAGKNFGKFDYQFLTRLHQFGEPFHHRFIDPAMWYLDSAASTAPCLYQCAAMEGLQVPKAKKRTALLDATLVAKLVLANVGVNATRKRVDVERWGGKTYYSIPG